MGDHFFGACSVVATCGSASPESRVRSSARAPFRSRGVTAAQRPFKPSREGANPSGSNARRGSQRIRQFAKLRLLGAAPRTCSNIFWGCGRYRKAPTLHVEPCGRESRHLHQSSRAMRRRSLPRRSSQNVGGQQRRQRFDLAGHFCPRGVDKYMTGFQPVVSGALPDSGTTLLQDGAAAAHQAHNLGGRGFESRSCTHTCTSSNSRTSVSKTDDAGATPSVHANFTE
jgi:hypothetical protein